MIILFIVLLIIFLIIIILALPVQIKIILKKIDDKEDLCVEFTLIPGLWKYHLEMTVIKIKLRGLMPYALMHFKTEGVDGKTIDEDRLIIDKPWNYVHKLMRISPIKNRKILLNYFKKTLKITKDFIKKIHCQKLYWQTYLGVGEPAVTALLSGNIWIIKNILYIFLKNNVQLNFKKPIFDVYPNFQKREFKIDFNCIFTFRLGHIIMAGCKIFIVTIKSILAQRG